MLNNREWALVIWGAVALGFVLLKPKPRESLAKVLRAMLARRLVITAMLYFGYLATVVSLAAWANVWEPALIKDTVIWAIGPGMVLTFGIISSSKKHYLRNALLASFELAVLIQFITNLFVLPLPAELALTPFLVLLGVIGAYAAQHPEHNPVARLVNVLLGAIGISLFIYATWNLINGWRELDATALAEAFVLPMWLTVVALPLAYSMALWAGYEAAFHMIDFFAMKAGTPTAARRAKRVLALRLHLRRTAIATFKASWTRQMAQAESTEDANAVVSDFLKAQRPAS
ncbi:hypothetical protein [Jiangella gansuensis]|uniref:hypothetical protein n=1 Tax=Jiangella gansuensis TaxID=281473 RepID=UPI00047B6BF8|nr:hypothetical protein [Jiangella gansuensis]